MNLQEKLDGKDVGAHKDQSSTGGLVNPMGPRKKFEWIKV